MPRIPTGTPRTALLVTFAALLLAGCGSDGPEIEIVRGAPEAGFPLRGGLSNDEQVLGDAADEWVEEDDESGRDGVLDDGPELAITALWAGRINDEEFVVLASDGHAALVGRRDEREPRWSLRKTVTIRDAEEPGVVVFSNGILLPENARSSTMVAEVSDIGTTTTDGLLHASSRYASDLPAGVLYLPDGLRRRRALTEQPPVIVRIGSTGFGALRTVGAGLRSRLQPGGDAFDRPALQRFVAATADPRSLAGSAGRFADPPIVGLVRDTRVAGVGPVMLIRTATSSYASPQRPSVTLGVGGSTVAGGEEAATLPLGPSNADGNPYRAVRGPAFGVGQIARATRLQENAGEGPAPLLVAAGDDDVATIEVLAGTRRWSGPGPILTVAISWRDDADVAVLGRDARGRLIVPAGAGDGPATVRVSLQP